MTTEIVDLAGLDRLGQRLAAELPAGSVVWLTGPLGAGKTTLTRSIVQSRGGDTEATSPTFALVHEHDGTHGAIFHVDCYRLRRPDDAADLDWQTLAAADLLLIEWPDRAGPWAPRPALTVALEIVDDARRRVTLQ